MCARSARRFQPLASGASTPLWYHLYRTVATVRLTVYQGTPFYYHSGSFYYQSGSVWVHPSFILISQPYGVRVPSQNLRVWAHHSYFSVWAHTFLFWFYQWQKGWTLSTSVGPSKLKWDNFIGWHNLCVHKIWPCSGLRTMTKLFDWQFIVS